MSKPRRTQFAIRPHDAKGTWTSNDRRYRAFAHEVLSDLERLCAEATALWPADVPKAQLTEQRYPALWAKARIRNRTSDTVHIFAAMAVEGFLNFYGVLRLGEAAYNEHFERLPVIRKLKVLLLICDSLQINEADSLVVNLTKIAEARNALVHPKAREVQGDPALHQGTAVMIPESAREIVANMEAFFDEFKLTVPAAADHVMNKPSAGKAP
jgi:hypothetical protein